MMSISAPIDAAGVSDSVGPLVPAPYAGLESRSLLGSCAAACNSDPRGPAGVTHGVDEYMSWLGNTLEMAGPTASTTKATVANIGDGRAVKRCQLRSADRRPGNHPHIDRGRTGNDPISQTPYLTSPA